MAQAHDLHDLASQALTFILRNLQEVIKGQEFNQISKSMLVKIITCDQLSVKSEKVVAEAVLAWVNGNQENRKHFVADLLQFNGPGIGLCNSLIVSNPRANNEFSILKESEENIQKEENKVTLIENLNYSEEKSQKFNGMDVSSVSNKQTKSSLDSCSEDDNPSMHNRLQHVEDMSPVESHDGKNVNTCNPYQASSRNLESALTYEEVHVDNITGVSSLSNLSTRLTEVIITVCRDTQRKHRGKIHDFSNIYFFHLGCERWEFLTRLPFTDRQDYAASVVNNVLYLTGGQGMDVNDIYCAKVVYNDLWAYDAKRDKWTELQPMNIPR